MGGMRDWDVCFIRGPNDWEAEVVDDFFWILGIHRMRWKLMKDRDFNIRSFYHKLRGSSFMVFPYKGIWKVKAPCHVSFFVWIAA